MKLLFRLAVASCAWPLLAMSRCAGDADLNFSLPPATQTGANTIGFVLAGKVWRDYGMSCGFLSSKCDSNRVRAWHSGSGTSYALDAGLNTTSRAELLTMYFINLSQPGSFPSYYYYYGSLLPAASAEFVQTENGRSTTYVTSRHALYQVTITRLDTIKRIVSGTFSGTLRNVADTTRTLTMSDGRFDVRYQR